MHSPTDDLVGIENASAIFTAAKHPKSFVSLSGADHLLSKRARCGLRRRGDRRMVGTLSRHGAGAGRDADRRRAGRRTAQRQVRAVGGRRHRTAFSPTSRRRPAATAAGRARTNICSPALGACTSMTIRLYADLKKIPLDARVRAAQARQDPRGGLRGVRDEGRQDRPHRARDTLEGDLSAEQRARLMEIADKCPVHRTLHGEINIRTREAA